MTKLLENAFAIAERPPATDPAQYASDVATMRAALAEIRRRGPSRDEAPKPVPRRGAGRVPDHIADRGPAAVEAFLRDLEVAERIARARAEPGQ